MCAQVEEEPVKEANIESVSKGPRMDMIYRPTFSPFKEES